MGEQLVGVAVRLGVVVVPGAASVGRAHHSAELDPDRQRVRGGWVERDRADVMCPGPRRERPAWLARHAAQLGERLPGLCSILGPVEVARLGPRVDDRPTGWPMRPRHRDGHDSPPSALAYRPSSTVPTYTRAGSCGSTATHRGAATVSTARASCARLPVSVRRTTSRPVTTNTRADSGTVCPPRILGTVV